MRHSTRNTFILTFCFLVLYQLPKIHAQTNFPGGRIALSFDGNIHDMDDWGASAMSLAMIDAANLNSRVVHLDYNNHLGQSTSSWENNMYASTSGAADRFGFNKAVFFNDQTQLSSAISNLAKAINASSSSNPLWILAAGPMETVWRGVNASQRDRRKYVRIVSHSTWNNDHSDTQALDNTWADLQNDFKGDGVQFYKIRDQNSSNGDYDFSTSNSQWRWLRDSDNSNFRWLYNRDAFSNKFDVSDAGMTYWLVSGGPNGGCENCGWRETRDLLTSTTSSDPPASDCPATFTEKNGLVVIEAESASAGSGWSQKTSLGGYTGSGYQEWTGSDLFNSAGTGTINYQIYVSKTGTYRFQWRNRIAKGTDNTEHNDSWLRFPDASNFYGQKGSSKVYPKGSGKSPNPNGASMDGWFKIYTNSSGWNWQTTTSDHDRHNIYVQFDSPGVYTLQIAGRSNGHAIDRMVLSHSSQSSSGAQNTSLGETRCDGSTANANPTVNAGSDQTLTLPKNSTTLTATASDADGSIASYQWTKVNGPNASLSGSTSRTLTVSNLVAGSYTFKVTVKDNEGATASDQVAVNVKEETVDPDPVADAHPIPGKIEAEAFTAQSGIQTESTSDTGGGKNIGYISHGDYADYRVNVTQAGSYTVAFRVASATNGGTITLRQGSSTLGSVSVSNTGGWQSWRTVQTEVSLSSGEQTLRLEFSGSSGYLFNVNYLSFAKVTSTTAGVYPVPGKVEAESYASMRGIQKELTSDSGGGQNIGYINGGDYADYRVKVAESGKYTVAFRVASAASGGKITLKRGSTTLGSVTVSNTGGWQSWRTVQTEVSLSSGEQTLRLEFSGSSGYLFNVNYMSFSRTTSARTADLASQAKGSAFGDDFAVASEVRVYPNPASEYVVVTGDEAVPYTIVSQEGRIVLSGTLDNDGQIPVSGLKGGLYYLRLQRAGSISSHKLVIKH